MHIIERRNVGMLSTIKLWLINHILTASAFSSWCHWIANRKGIFHSDTFRRGTHYFQSAYPAPSALPIARWFSLILWHYISHLLTYLLTYCNIPAAAIPRGKLEKASQGIAQCEVSATHVVVDAALLRGGKSRRGSHRIANISRNCGQI